ncbi:hypothetical protein GALMADRAFT_226718 [Galerina marginata CBS 339.88]|uniref:F-box domain-containing protein n=1 Tax=Galerina marginata (strain CBS 339.88) TaxID=685588 RepID=A0A067SYD7_GALM3|nr:hypothetical protein GALMADRAFT_226718 [Galerina marginata CBS 339.88]
MPESSGSKSASNARKRAASNAIDKRPVKRSKAGKLEAVVEKLPPEVVYRIVDYLDPQTLMNLSRSNKLFRDTLLSSDLFWKTAREGSGMPELEAQDITERQYILLVFDKNCHDCSKPNVQEINFVNCARLCSDCRFQTKVTEPQLRKFLKSLHPMAKECAKYTSDAGYRIPRGIKKLSEKLHTMQGDELEKFVEERQQLKEAIEKDARKIEKWLLEQANNKYDEDYRNRQSRRGSIRQKLLALGWTDEILLRLGGYWYSKREVNQPRKLTPRIWKTIEKPLVKALRSDLISARHKMRRDALIPQYKNLMQADPQPDLFPSRATFFEMQSVKSVWQKDYGPDPTARAVEIDDFPIYDDAEWLAALPAVRAEVACYQQDVTDLAVERLTKAYIARDFPVPNSPIQDPRSYFRYKEYEPQGDWGPPREIVLQFPAIHRAMRDRQDGRRVGFNPPEAAEFKSVRSGGVTLDETLNVEL